MIGILCLCVAIALPPLALAEFAINPNSFGNVQGTLDFCARVDSQSAPKYKERAKLMVRGASEKDLGEARNSDEYKDAYDWAAARGEESIAAPANTSPSAVTHSAVVPSIATTVTSGRQAMMYRKIWGIEDIHVRSTASGSLIRFSYRVIDADKAKPLNDQRATPYLIDEKARLALQVPVTEKVGQLRQVAKPLNGREYWMVFSNKGRYVKPGNHVDVVIGTFRVEGLVVEGISSSVATH
jgi:hypothetical protein